MANACIVTSVSKTGAKFTDFKIHIPLRNTLMTLLVKDADNRAYICGDLWLSHL